MADSQLKRNPYRRLLWFLGLVALAMSVTSVALVHHYDNTRPREADAALGRTHAVKIHGHMVYLTGGELAAALVTHAIVIISLGGFLGVLLKSRASRSGTNATPPAESSPRL
jgi:hypothetical protein